MATNETNEVTIVRQKGKPSVCFINGQKFIVKDYNLNQSELILVLPMDELIVKTELPQENERPPAVSPSGEGA